MRKARRDAVRTKLSLLAAASEVFASKGYWEATTADVCEKAGANIAAVNYHFGSKDALYVEAWKYSVQQTLQAHPPDGGVKANEPAEKRLRARIMAFMYRVADSKSYDIDIFQKEMANPTGLLTQLIGKAMETTETGFRDVIKDLLGPSATKKQIALCQMSVMTQCMDPMLRARLTRKARRKRVPPFEIGELAEHIFQFSLAGIRHMREDTEGKGTGDHAVHG